MTPRRPPPNRYHTREDGVDGRDNVPLEVSSPHVGSAATHLDAEGRRGIASTTCSGEREGSSRAHANDRDVGDHGRLGCDASGREMTRA